MFSKQTRTASVWREIFPILFCKKETSQDWQWSPFSSSFWLLSPDIRDANILFPFPESSNWKALRNQPCSRCSRVDQILRASTPSLGPHKEWKPQIAKARFCIIRVLATLSISGAFSWQQRETAMRKSLLGLIRKNVSNGFSWFSLLASVTKAKYRATRRFKTSRNHICGSIISSLIVSHMSCKLEKKKLTPSNKWKKRQNGLNTEILAVDWQRIFLIQCRMLPWNPNKGQLLKPCWIF